MSVVIGYTRVSTEDQKNSGLGLEAQRASIAAWASSRGLTVTIYEDAGITGTSMKKRPALEEALCAARKGAVLVAYSMSRFARSTRDMLTIAERLKRQGADLVSLTESIDTTTATGRLVFTLLASLAQFERDLTSERTKAALAALKARGVKLGWPAGTPREDVSALWESFRQNRRKDMILDFCVFCGIKEGVEQHHVVPKAEGGSDEPANILSVCGAHHGLIHNIRRPANISKLTSDGLQAAKARGVKLGSGNSHAGGEANRLKWARIRASIGTA